MHCPKKSILVLLAASCTLLSAQAPPVIHGRYRYAIGDLGALGKLDTISEREILSINLSTRTGKLKIPPTSGPGAVDGCLAAQAIYDAARGRFYTVVAEHYKADPGFTNNFRVLAFSVPAIQLVGQWPAGKNVNWDGDQPFIDEIQNGIPKLINATSGDSVLILLHKADDLLPAVAHPKTKTLTVLNNVSDSPDAQTPWPSGIPFAKLVHLTPGGGYVVVERIDGLYLFDAKTGKKVKSVPNPKSEMKYFLDICPAGKVIFAGRDRFRFVNLGMTFPNVAVEKNDPSVPCGGHFYADR